jgi:hypothetical protein
MNIFRFTSNRIEFDILGNEILEFNCGSLKCKKTLLVYMYITILRNRYLWIKKVASVDGGLSLSNIAAAYGTLLQHAILVLV